MNIQYSHAHHASIANATYKTLLLDCDSLEELSSLQRSCMYRGRKAPIQSQINQTNKEYSTIQFEQENGKYSTVGGFGMSRNNKMLRGPHDVVVILITAVFIIIEKIVHIFHVSRLISGVLFIIILHLVPIWQESIELEYQNRIGKQE